jgi:hypothetical protein
MRLHIRELILWPRNTTLAPQRIPFETGKLNVISGISRTGKSAVIPIIDYCLTSRRCAIPVGVIRQHCSWFGVVIDTAAGQKLLARREPGQNDSTGEMFVLEGESVEVPAVIESGNTNADKVRRMLDQLAGLTNLDFAEDESASFFKSRPSFRDMMAFTMQPQNIVANQNVLFYRADSFEHREKLRTIFPYVLNAVTAETLAHQHELDEITRELRRKERELASAREVSQRWIAEIRAWVSQARELGLLTREFAPETETAVLVNALREVVLPSTHTVGITAETIGGAVAELVKLQDAEQNLSRQLAKLRHRYQEMSTLRASATQYHSALHIQRDRLKLAEWLSDIGATSQSCPLCGTAMIPARDQVAPLLQTLRTIEASTDQFSGSSEAFDREFHRVRKEIRELTERLNGVRVEIEALTRESDDARAQQETTLAASHFIGRLQQALQNYERLGSGGDLVAEIESLREKEHELRALVDENQVLEKTRIATQQVASFAHRIVPLLDAEHPDYAITLSVKDLSIKIVGGGRDDYLWQIGSGSNWLSYHIAVILALHQFFFTVPNSPVPSFIIFDQPSQVYFPRRLAERPGEKPDESDFKYRDVDTDSVKGIFRVLSDAAAAVTGRLQLIVLDHAADTIWGDIPNIYTAAEWRENGARLVPQEWIDSAAEGAP